MQWIDRFWHRVHEGASRDWPHRYQEPAGVGVVTYPPRPAIPCGGDREHDFPRSTSPNFRRHWESLRREARVITYEIRRKKNEKSDYGVRRDTESWVNEKKENWEHKRNLKHKNIIEFMKWKSPRKKNKRFHSERWEENVFMKREQNIIKSYWEKESKESKTRNEKSGAQGKVKGREKDSTKRARTYESLKGRTRQSTNNRV